VKRPSLLLTEGAEKLTTRPAPGTSSTLWHFVHAPWASLPVRKSKTADAGLLSPFGARGPARESQEYMNLSLCPVGR
jgi:hypothetical protein